MLAHVLGFDGALGARSEVVDGALHRALRRARSPTARARPWRCASWRRAEGIDLAASYAYSDSESDLPMLRAVGHPVGGQPRRRAAPRRARGGLGDHALRAARPAPEGRPARCVAGARWSATGARTRGGRAGDEPARAQRRAARDPRPRAALRRRRDRAAGRRPGIASTPSRARSSTHLGELGLMGVCVPEEHGGAGADFLSYVLVLEELSRADAGVGVTVAVHTSAGTLPMLAHGTPEQVGRMVPPLAQGHELAAFALTESGSGSDAGAMRTRAESSTASPAPSSGSPTARTPTTSSSSPAIRSARSALRRAPRRARASRVTREEEKLGLNSSSTADLSFEDTPAELLGVQGAGMRIALSDPRRRAHRHRRAGGRASRRPRSTWPRPTPRSATPSGGRSAASAPSSRSSPTCRPRSRPPARSMWRAARLKEAGRPHTRRGRAGQALRLARRAPLDRRGDPGPRRLRLHQGVPGRALLPRRQGDRDLRGHERDPAPGHRPRAAGRGRARVVVRGGLNCITEGG